MKLKTIITVILAFCKLGFIMIWAAKNVSAERDFTRWGDPRVFSNMSEFYDYDFISPSRKHVYSIVEDSSVIDFRLNVVEKKPLIVFFNGAQNRTPDYKFPSFSGLRVTPREKASLLCINDPSLYMSDDIKMAWYAGNKCICLQNKIIPSLVSKVYENIGATSLIFIGGSAGGTASLFYAKKFPGSFCITSNPQTDILKYRKHHVNRYLKKCLGVNDIETARSFPQSLGGIVTDITDFYSGAVTNHTIYLQNKEDRGHFGTHFHGFISSLNLHVPQEFGRYQLNDKLLVEVGDWGAGHKSAPREFWANMILNVIENEKNWKTFFDNYYAGELLEFKSDIHS